MSTLIKQGVFGDLNREIANAKRKMEKFFDTKGEDLIITSIREGTHTPGSMHPQGDAFDFRTPTKVTFSEIRITVGNDFDVCQEADHGHIEFDPVLPRLL